MSQRFRFVFQSQSLIRNIHRQETLESIFCSLKRELGIEFGMNEMVIFHNNAAFPIDKRPFGSTINGNCELPFIFMMSDEFLIINSFFIEKIPQHIDNICGYCKEIAILVEIYKIILHQEQDEQKVIGLSLLHDGWESWQDALQIDALFQNELIKCTCDNIGNWNILPGKRTNEFMEGMKCSACKTLCTHQIREIGDLIDAGKATPLERLLVYRQVLESMEIESHICIGDDFTRIWLEVEGEVVFGSSKDKWIKIGKRSINTNSDIEWIKQLVELKERDFKIK